MESEYWQRNGVECLEVLLQHPDIDVNSRDKYGRVALHYMEDVKCMKRLLKRTDLQVNIRDKKGRAPIHTLASREGDIFEIFIADPRVHLWIDAHDWATPTNSERLEKALEKCAENARKKTLRKLK